MKCIGIDKTVIKNFTVERVDFNKLLSESNAEKVICMRKMKGKYNYFHDREEEGNFNTIIIKDNIVFNTLKVDVKKVGENLFVKYAMLDLSIRELQGNNLMPLNIKAYKLQLTKLFKYIEERYGLIMETSKVKFDRVELNCTIKLDRRFEEYIRAIDILCHLAPKTYREYVTQKDKKRDEIDYFLIKNNSMQCKFYNKSKQLEEVYNVETDSHILRVEYTLIGDKKINDIFSNGEVNQLTDEQIQAFIKQQFTKDFINRYNKHKDDSIKQITKVVKELRAESKQWTKQLIIKLMDIEIGKKTPICLDAEHIREVVKKVDTHNWSRNLKNIDRYLPKNYVGQERKVMEIFDKISMI